MGLSDVLNGMKNGPGGGGGGSTGPSGGMSPLTMGVLAFLAYKALKGSGVLGSESAADQPQTPVGSGSPEAGRAAGGSDWLTGLQKVIAGGGAGGILSGGLSDLLKQFQNNGQGEKAASWVASGPNKPIRPDELEAALGEERISWLMQQTGLSRDELLQGLSRELPSAIDELTPAGRLPSENDSPQIAPSTVRPN